MTLAVMMLDLGGDNLVLRDMGADHRAGRAERCHRRVPGAAVAAQDAVHQLAEDCGGRVCADVLDLAAHLDGRARRVLPGPHESHPVLGHVRHVLHRAAPLRPRDFRLSRRLAQGRRRGAARRRLRVHFMVPRARCATRLGRLDSACALSLRLLAEAHLAVRCRFFFFIEHTLNFGWFSQGLVLKYSSSIYSPRKKLHDHTEKFFRDRSTQKESCKIQDKINKNAFTCRGALRSGVSSFRAHYFSRGRTKQI